MMKSDFYYELPEKLIARHPLQRRSESRLMVLHYADQHIQHEKFENLLNYLEAGDLLVFNNSKVIPARLKGHKQSGGAVEVLVERVLNNHQAFALISASKAPKIGSFIQIANQLILKIEDKENEFYKISFPEEKSIYDWLELYGEIPLPPYIDRPASAEDKERYQTVYAQSLGSVAAPTAGLHFDQAMLTALEQKGVQLAYVTLHVGAGTFLPMRVNEIAQHQMHKEWLAVPEDVCEKIHCTKASGKKVIAVGTTSVRSLETAAATGILKPYVGETDLFIYPGFKFNIIDGMVTNFHLPSSTLLMLVSAFAGKEFIFKAYDQAITEQYRFFSYGDAMLILK